MRLGFGGRNTCLRSTLLHFDKICSQQRSFFSIKITFTTAATSGEHPEVENIKPRRVHGVRHRFPVSDWRICYKWSTEFFVFVCTTNRYVYSAEINAYEKNDKTLGLIVPIPTRAGYCTTQVCDVL